MFPKNNRIQVKSVSNKLVHTEKYRSNFPKFNMAEMFHDYCTNSTIHGISYLGAKDKSIAEKIWWVIALFLSVIACFYLITTTWVKWTNNPVTLSFESEQFSIGSIPFPAVTVCPVNKISQTEYNYTEMFRNRENLTEDEYIKFWDISLVCNLEKFAEDFDNCLINVTDDSAIENILNYAPTMHTSLSLIKWRNRIQSIDATFAEILTEEGRCFTFNILSQQDMFTDEMNKKIRYIDHNIQRTKLEIEDEYNTIKESDYPRSTPRAGIYSGLSFTLSYTATDIDYVCGMPITGHKVILHNPKDFPKVAEQYFLLPANTKCNVIVKPELTRASNSLYSMPAHTRKCYFSNEKFLRFYKIYTQNNCLLECDANITITYCGCVAFHMPRTEDTPICGYANKKCMDNVKDIIIDIEMMVEETKLSSELKEKIKLTREIFDHCDCLPSCNSLQYSVEISQTTYHLSKTLVASGTVDEYFTQEMQDELNNGLVTTTQVDIFFKKSLFLGLQRTELYGRVDFLSNCGGILGLFLGFSLLSLLEIIYFLTIRLWFHCTRSPKKI